MSPEVSKLIDHVDLMVDEFKRIRALAQGGLTPLSDKEIIGLCDRAITKTHQYVPVIVQRDRALEEVRQMKEVMEYLPLDIIDVDVEEPSVVVTWYDEYGAPSQVRLIPGDKITIKRKK